MSKGQTKKTREAAGNRRKLTRAEKKQIAEAIRKAKGDGKARTAQQTIPYLAMYPDGICKVTEKKYSKCVVFEDINYQLAQADDKTAIFENWCDFLNYFDASVSVQLSFINQGTQREQAEKAISIPAQEDAFNSIRTEYSDMLKNQLSKGNNGLVKHKYITFTVEADNKAAAKSRLSRIETDVLNNFKVLGVTARPLSGYERLKVLHGVFHPEGEPFSFSFDWLTPTGLTTKDFIAPSSFCFGEGRYFRMGKKIGAASFLEILAPELNDRMLADILDLETGVIVNLHIRSIDQSEAIKTIKRKITDLDKMKIEEQKKAVRSGYDMDIIPSDLATFGSEAKNLLQDLQSRNERMFLLIRDVLEQVIEFIYLLKHTDLIEQFFGANINTGDLDEENLIDEYLHFGGKRYNGGRKRVFQMASSINENASVDNTLSLYDIYRILSEQCHNSYFLSTLDDIEEIETNKKAVALTEEQLTYLMIIISRFMEAYRK